MKRRSSAGVYSPEQRARTLLVLFSVGPYIVGIIVVNAHGGVRGRIVENVSEDLRRGGIISLLKLVCNGEILVRWLRNLDPNRCKKS